jgi:hypothetical protein
MQFYLVRRTPAYAVDPLFGLRYEVAAGHRAQFVPMGAFQLPTLGLREIIGVPRPAQRPHRFGADTRLLGDFARGARFDALAAFEMSLGQVPAAVAAHHQPLAAVVHHHAARRFDLRKIGRKRAERRVGIGRNDCDAVVRFENFRYLRS